LAKRAGLSCSAVCRAERGGIVNARTAKLISVALDKPVEELFDFNIPVAGK
jgi:transcriptional regulator with XRE-family HTH domain